MRLLLALVYISIGMWLYLHFGGENLHPNIGIAFFFLLMFSSVIVCNEGFIRKLRGISYEEHLKKLIANGKAKIEKYKTVNSLVFEDLGTGCTAYLIDVGNRNILVLYGQDYGFEPIFDDPEFNQNRKFPTESFSLTRELKNKMVLEVNPEGMVIEPNIVDSPNIDNLAKFGFKLEDGEIVDKVDFGEVLDSLKSK